MRKMQKVCEQCGYAFEKDPRNTWAYFAKSKYCSRECFGQSHAKNSAEKRHRAKVHAEIIQALVECGFEPIAPRIAEAIIANGHVPHVPAWRPIVLLAENAAVREAGLS